MKRMPKKSYASRSLISAVFHIRHTEGRKGSSRPVRIEDFYHFDLIIGMDDRNIDDLKDKAPSPEEWKKIHRMTEYCTRIPADHVPDPYYGGAEGFEYVLDVLEDACAGLLTSLTPDS